MQCSMLHRPSTCLPRSNEISTCPLCLYCSVHTLGICVTRHSMCLQPLHRLPTCHDNVRSCAHRNESGKDTHSEFKSPSCLPKFLENARLCADRNEPGKKKHPEFSSLPVCRECFDLLGAAAWHLQGDWKDEGGHDKYCRFCAGSAPGGTSTLLHCSQDGCKKGFCTG